MDASSIVIVVAIIAIVLGALIGWLLGSRGASAGRGVADALRLQLDAVREERDTHARSIEAQRGEHALAIDTLRSEHHDLGSRHAGVVAAQGERDAAHQRQLADLESKFAEVGG